LADGNRRFVGANLLGDLGKDFSIVKLDPPVGCSIFQGDIFRPPKIWTERTFSRLIYWNEVDRGSHFAGLEQPEIFVREVRVCFRNVRET